MESEIRFAFFTGAGLVIALLAILSLGAYLGYDYGLKAGQERVCYAQGCGGGGSELR